MRYKLITFKNLNGKIKQFPFKYETSEELKDYISKHTPSEYFLDSVKSIVPEWIFRNLRTLGNCLLLDQKNEIKIYSTKSVDVTTRKASVDYVISKEDVLNELKAEGYKVKLRKLDTGWTVADLVNIEDFKNVIVETND